MNIGTKRSMRKDFKLCDKTLCKAKDNKSNVLGVWFTGNKANPILDMKNKTMRDGHLVFKQLKTYFDKSSFNTIKKEYTTLILHHKHYTARSSLKNTIVNNTYSSNCKWRNVLDRFYLRMFVKKKPKNKDLNNLKGHDFVIPLMPSQLSIVKSLVLIFKILSGKLSNARIGAEALLEINRNKTNLITRRQNRGFFELSTERAEYHNEKLLILKRHRGY